jgi:hypothetical protein
MYRSDSVAQVQQGDTISVWMEFPILADGRAHFTFGSSPAGTLSLVAAPNTNQSTLDATGARWSTAGFRAAGTDNAQLVRFTIADLVMLELGVTEEKTITMVQNSADHGASIGSTPAVNEEFSRSGIAASPLPAAIPSALDCIDLSTVAEQALEFITGLDSLDALLRCDRVWSRNCDDR